MRTCIRIRDMAIRQIFWEMRQFLIILQTVCTMSLLGGCSYQKLPPKTDDAGANYVLPAGEVPTAEENDIVNAAKAEYRNDITN